jgi:hypothetical protein
MLRIIAVYTLALLVAAATAALADQNATYTGPESASEKAFVASIQDDLMKRFPTAADAEKAGYFRYTSVDDTGAISYTNLAWTSADSKHPSQLWYGTDGNLLGADFSVPYAAGSKRPQLWGINPGRWVEFDGHIHWVGKNATGELTYDNYVMDEKFVAAGGSLTDPSAATLVKLKRVEDPDSVVKIFQFPAIWDLIVWVKPNPNGAFAEKNPDVKT